MKKLPLVLSLLLIAGFIQRSAAQEVITIQQAIEKTLNNNLQVKKAELSESLADENLKQAKLALYPTLSAGISQSMAWGRNNSGTSGIYENTQNYNFGPDASAGVDLFNGFSKINQIRQNKVLLESGKASTEKLKNDLTLQVITSYLDILYNKDRLKAAQQQLVVSQEQLTQQQELLNVGNKTLADVAESRSLVATAELDVTTATNALTISYLTLAQLMDIPSATRYDIQAPVLSSFNKPSTNYNPEQVYSESMRIFPDIKLAGLQTEVAKRGIDIAKGSLYPRLSLSGGYGTGYFYNYNARPENPNVAFGKQIENNISKRVGMSLSIPIFNGLQARSGVTRARINLQQFQADEQLAKNNLNKIIYQAVADLKAAESTYESTTKTFNARQEAFAVIEQRYNVGLVNSLDYSTSLTNRNRAEIDNIRAKYDLLFKAKVIDYYLGKQIIF
ncbi:TolC family protein [Pedobacter metabolipauper]|uniref:Outer membrane protein n=1 Tax=Pedobacter metabolipauper TaxID=425513 RepID=A0A4R6ST20_9SPHI|nr:TolC family protein [Pedobacter metabolipauper]TDQ07555.1 outer membrane protein [Pedobacter metabolipauper]